LLHLFETDEAQPQEPVARRRAAGSQ